MGVQRRRSHSLVSVGVTKKNTLVVVIMNRLSFAFVASSILLVNGQVELRSFLGNCVNGGTNLDSCLLQLADKLRPYMKTGIPSLNIPKTDPMDIDRSVNAHNQLNPSEQGGEDALHGDLCAQGNCKGTLSHAGSLGSSELDESLAPAPYTTSFTGTTVSGVAKMDVVGGKLQIVQQPDVTINVEGLNVQMENLFGGEADGLAKVVLRFVNKESDKFIMDFQPEIAKQVSNLIKTFFNSALDNIPVNTSMISLSTFE